MKTRISYNAIVDPANGLIITHPGNRRHGIVLGYAWHGQDGFMGCGNVVAVVLEDGPAVLELRTRPILVPVRHADFCIIEEKR